MPPHYERWTAILGDLGHFNDGELSDFRGAGGGLLYIGDMDFLHRRLIAATPDEFLSRPDVKFMGPPEDFFSQVDDESEFDDGDDDDDCLLDMDNEADGPDLSEMAEVMVSISSNLATAVRRWCFANGKIASDLIDQAADYTLSRLIIQAASAGSQQGDEALAALSSDLDDCLADTAEEERLEMAIAVGQFKDFMCSLESLGEFFRAAGIPPEEVDNELLDEPELANRVDQPRLSIAKDIVEQADGTRDTSDSPG